MISTFSDTALGKEGECLRYLPTAYRYFVLSESMLVIIRCILIAIVVATADGGGAIYKVRYKVQST